MNQVIELLKKTADRLEKPGAWCQNVSGSSHGPNCLLGGLWEVASLVVNSTSIDTYRPLYLKAARVVGDRLGSRHLASWNDEDDRTQAEVVNLLRETAKELEKAEHA